MPSATYLARQTGSKRALAFVLQSLKSGQFDASGIAVLGHISMFTVAGTDPLLLLATIFVVRRPNVQSARGVAKSSSKLPAQYTQLAVDFGYCGFYAALEPGNGKELSSMEIAIQDCDAGVTDADIRRTSGRFTPR